MEANNGKLPGYGAGEQKVFRVLLQTVAWYFMRVTQTRQISRRLDISPIILGQGAVILYSGKYYLFQEYKWEMVIVEIGNALSEHI